MATTETSIKAYLDSLSQLPGSILYRNIIAWQALPPGQEGQLLTVDESGFPAWTHRGTYFPAAMQYDTPGIVQTLTTMPFVNGAFTVAFRAKGDPLGPAPRIWYASGGGGEYGQCYMTAAGKIQIRIRTNVGGDAVFIQSLLPIDDAQFHYGWFQYNPTNGAMEFIIDGQDADDPAWPNRVAGPATLRSTSAGTLRIGNLGTPDRVWNGQIGAFGWKNSALPNWQDFMTPDGWPLPIDHNTWAQWLGQPQVWHESNYLQSNRGSAGPFTPSGPLTLADPLTWS